LWANEPKLRAAVVRYLGTERLKLGEEKRWRSFAKRLTTIISSAGAPTLRLGKQSHVHI
jgi:hypothetical protein